MEKHLFVTQNIDEAATLSGSTPPPTVIYSKSESYINYIPKPIDFGMFLYSNGTVGTGITDDIVGLCVIPSTHTDDGNPRFMCLTDTDENGNKLIGSNRTNIHWGERGISVLTDLPYFQIYNKISITTTGDPCTVIGTNEETLLPSDIFTTGTPIVADCLPKGVYFADTSYYVPCPYPYLADWSKNPDYSSGDVDTKFLDGWRLTRVLTGLGDEYEAAKAAVAYSKNTPGFETYLPTIGELGYVMARLRRINEILGILGNKAQTFDTNEMYWSSSENSDNGTRSLDVPMGVLTSCYGKFNGLYVRPFIRKP